MSLAEGVLGIIEEHAASRQFATVRSVWLEIGELAGVEPDALRFCFDAVMRGSLAEGAVLNIVEVPGSGWCMECCETVPMHQRYGACPRCGGYRLQPTGGTEMRVRELEVD